MEYFGAGLAALGVIAMYMLVTSWVLLRREMRPA